MWPMHCKFINNIYKWQVTSNAQQERDTAPVTVHNTLEQQPIPRLDTSDAHIAAAIQIKSLGTCTEETSHTALGW